jgi:hypothetical protein
MVEKNSSQPTYEVIKRDDIAAAFEIALKKALAEMMARIDHLIDLYSATAPSSLWVWDYTSRWDYDKWW